MGKGMKDRSDGKADHKPTTSRDWVQWLQAHEEAGLTRRTRVNALPQGPRMQIDGREMLGFCSNDYLGLAADPALAAAMHAGIDVLGVGAGSAHLINGHFDSHERLERALSDWLTVDRALLFSTGYMANMGVVSALMGRGDRVFADRLNHASLVDAVRLSGAKLDRYRHADMDDLRTRLQRSRRQPGARMILTDGVFSMDGDIAPLDDLLDLADEFDAWLVVDDAHGFGVLGEEGRGSLADVDPARYPNLLRVGTLGKAFGTAGAFVAGDELPIELLLQRARTYLFTTAQPPAVAEATLAALEIVRHQPWRREALRERIEQFRSGCPLPEHLMASITPIQPLLTGESHDTIELAARLAEAGIWVPAIRPPTVPVGQARLRITFSAAHSSADVDRLLAVLDDAARDFS